MAEHTHDHDPAPNQEHDNGPPGEYEIMSRAIQELLEEGGHITTELLNEIMELFVEEYPSRGPRVIARAWVDQDFKQKLLDE